MARSSLMVMAGRGLAASVFCVGLLGVAAGCGAGQIAQTAQMVPPVPGVNVQTQLPNGQLAIRNALLVYPGPNGYPLGGTAHLSLRIVNDSPSTIRLTGATSPDGQVVLTSAAPTTASPTPSTAPTPSATAAPSPTASPGATPSGAPTAGTPAQPSAPAVPSATPSVSPTSPRPVTLNLEIPPRGLVILDTTAAYRLQLVGLTRPIKPGESIRLTLTFSGGQTIADMTVPMGVPSSPARRLPAAPNPEGRPD